MKVREMKPRMRSLVHDHKTISKRTNDSVERLRPFAASRQSVGRTRAPKTAVNGRGPAAMFSRRHLSTARPRWNGRTAPWKSTALRSHSCAFRCARRCA